jgi:tetratricopeptide (TPR) repeat protein
MRELNDIIAQGDAFRNDGRLYCAEMEYDRALEIEAMNVRALFGLGLIYTARRELSKTRELLTELVNIKATFHGKNQYLFNEFGIALRKTGLFNEAILYYDKALKLTKKDEHLYYNLARAHYENGNWSFCLDNLIRSHTLNPKLKLTQHLFEVIVGLADDERLLRHYNKPPIPPEVAQTARRILAAEQGHVSLDEGPVLNHNRQENARSGDRIFSSDRQNDE